MNAEKVLDIVLREMQAYAYGWRCDWSDFDGRHLRDQLNDLAIWAEGALTEEVVDGDYIEGTKFYEGR